MFYFMSRMVSALAGKTTLAEIVVQIFSDQHTRELISYALTTGALGWGLNERRLRKSKVRHFAKRLKKTEEHLDPSRSSSHLTETGDTRPEDR